MPNVFVPQKFFPQHITGFSSSSNKINIEEHLYIFFRAFITENDGDISKGPQQLL